MQGVGADRCVLETDAPYLAPVPFRGKRNESAYIPHIAERLALATGTTVAEIARITTTNAEALFRR
jgi:TatD DNase family protein